MIYSPSLRGSTRERRRRRRRREGALLSIRLGGRRLEEGNEEL
jgi:hypothetical protein